MAPARLTSDSSASESRPTEPVIRYAEPLNPMVASAAAIDRIANRRSEPRLASSLVMTRALQAPGRRPSGAFPPSCLRFASSIALRSASAIVVGSFGETGVDHDCGPRSSRPPRPARAPRSPPRPPRSPPPAPPKPPAPPLRGPRSPPGRGPRSPPERGALSPAARGALSPPAGRSAPAGRSVRAGRASTLGVAPSRRRRSLPSLGSSSSTRTGWPTVKSSARSVPRGWPVSSRGIRPLARGPKSGRSTNTPKGLMLPTRPSTISPTSGVRAGGRPAASTSRTESAMRRFSGSSASITASTVWPVLNTSFTCVTRCSAACETCTRPSMPGSSETNAPNSVMRTTVPVMREPTA